MRSRSIAALALLSAIGCTPSGGRPLAGPPTDSGVGTGDAGGGSDTGVAGEPTYYGEVDDILAEHCWGCHSAAGGGIAPFDLDVYDVAAEHAGRIASETAARTMPPFFARNDGSCQHFQDHGRWLDQAEIDTLAEWALNGAPEGVHTTDPTPMDVPHVTSPSAMITMPTPYVAQRRGTDPNEIRCFVADPHVTSDAFITAYEVVPGEARVVHHVIVYEPESDANAASAAGMQGTDGRPGFACNGGPVVPAHPVALWAPGGSRTPYPADTGLALPAGRQLIIQVHYNLGAFATTDTIPPDQTSIRFETTPTVTHPATMILLSQNVLNLSPRQEMVMSDPKTIRVPLDGRVWGVFPHMHVLGRTLELQLTHAGSTDCAIDVEQWDFGWQQAYFYDAPITVSRGDMVSIQCGYDTRMRDAMTTFGEGTEDEMCLSFFYATGQ